MEQNKIGITGMGSVSALGQERSSIWKKYQSPETLIRKGLSGEYIAAATSEVNAACQQLLQENKYYAKVDRSVLLALLAARKAVAEAGWIPANNFGINMASSRGATNTFEAHFEDFKKHPQSKTSTLTSPMTTLGNLATWVANDVQSNGPAISHSITCSSAAHALLNGLAWLRSGMAEKFLIGGTEAPLTNFTLAQMKALKIYAEQDSLDNYPCRSLDLQKQKNTMVLGEGAACFALEKNPEQPLALIAGAGFYSERFDHPTQISKEGVGFQKAMEQALVGIPKESIDAIVLHAPGTIQGDQAEYEAIRTVFNQKTPKLTTNKWKIGHTLGASAALSIEWAILMLQNDIFVDLPFGNADFLQQYPLGRIMVNALGFGGNAVSIILEKP